jgi:murein DD-endopeptidase MepM/ murein hydrolase activator NlpD
MAQLDSNIVLKAFATPQLDIVGTMRDAEDRKRQQMLQQRQDSEYAQQQVAQARQMQDAADERDVVRMYGTDETGARQKAFGTGNAALVAKLDAMGDAGRKRAYEVSQHTAPLLLSLKRVPPQQRGQAFAQIIPQLQQAGFGAADIQRTGQDLSDAALDQHGVSAMTIADYTAANKPVVVNGHLVTPQGQSLYDAPEPTKYVTTPAGSISTQVSGPGMGGGTPARGAPAASGGEYIPPPANLIQTVTGGKGQVGSGFGPRTPPSPGASAFHNGVDVPLPAGTPVNAAADGTVIAAWNDTAHGGGQSVRIRHADGTVTGYADLGGYNVKVGQQVRAGQPIGTAGSSGSTSTGNHVHFSVRGPGGGAAPSEPAMSGPRTIVGPPKAQSPGQGGKAPSGYRYTPDGTLEPIPGGPADKAKTPPKDAAYSQSAMDAFDRAISSGERLLKHPGFAARVGSSFDPASYGSMNPFTGKPFAGTEAANFEAELSAMKAQVFLPMVQSMKGMGALSNAEGEKLTAAIGALDTKMSETAFASSLKRIIKDLNTYKTRATGSAPVQPAQQRQGPARIANDADFAKLPSGAQFIGPDGHVRRKP